MKVKTISFFLFIVFGCAAIPGGPAAGEVRNRIVAIVNDDLATLYELNAQIRMMTRKEPDEMRRQNEEEFMKVRRRVLDLLIEEKLTKQKVEELGISVDSKDVDAAIERIKQNNSLTQDDLEAALEKDGMTYKEYRKNLRGQIERMQLINAEVQSKIIIRDEVIRAYYEAHKDDFVVNAEVHLASIFIVGPVEIPGQKRALRTRAAAIVERLKTGEDFAQLARKYSKGPGAGEGGDLGVFKTNQLNETLRETLKGMSAGDISEPISLPTGYQIVKVIDKKEGRTRSADEVRDTIFEILYKKEVEKRYIAWMKELREKSYIKIIF
ncbi:MAG: peptidylprolyl isomerase [Deltaproteobacteria bacterium]|nr:peptidylprolyl isomerase [Deltaproteobacteria bacterium]